jgi:hypothetical protein
MFNELSEGVNLSARGGELEVNMPPLASHPQFEMLFAIEIVGIPKYDDCSTEVHPCRGTCGTTDRGYSTDA